MAKSAHSKVIFLPAQNQTVQEAMAKAFSGEESSQQKAVNSSIVERM